MSPRRIPQSDLEERALGYGDPNSQSRVAGKQKARHAALDLTDGLGSAPGTIKEVDVLHDLGQIPTSCELDSVENAAVPGTFIIANPVRRENWSHGHVHMSVRLVSGSFDGCRANFIVKGK